MKKILSLFFVIMFIIGTDTFLISPLLPTLRELYNVSVEMSGWMVSSYALGYALFALIAGPVSDGLNRKQVMTWGMTAFGVTTFLCGLSPNFWTMIMFRFLAGVSAAFVTPQVWAAIPSLVPPQQIIKSMGIATAGLSFSQMLGLPLGGYLASYHWSIPFFIIAICSVFIVFMIHIVLPDIKPAFQLDEKVPITNRYRTLLSKPKAFKTFLAYFTFQTGNFAAFSYLGTWLSDDFHFNVQEIATAMLILGLGNLFGSLFGIHLITRLGKSLSLYLGITILAALYIVLPKSMNITFVEMNFFILFFITGIIFTLMMSLLQTLSASSRGTIAALANSCMYVGQTVGASLAGIIYTMFGGFTAVGVFTFILYILSIFLFKFSNILPDKNVEHQSKPA